MPRHKKPNPTSSPLVARYRGPDGVPSRQLQQAMIIAFGTIRESMALAGLSVSKPPFVFRDDQVDSYFENSDGDRRVVIEVVKDVYVGLKGCVPLSADGPMDRLAKMEARFRDEFHKIGLYGITVAIAEVAALTPRAAIASAGDARTGRYQGKQPGLTPRGGPVRPTAARQFHVVGVS